jgi:hypothetical protein
MRGCAELLVIAFLCGTFSLSAASVDVCWKGDSDCPTCPSRSASFSSLLYLTASNVNLVTNLLKAEKVISSLGKNNSIWLQPLLNLHTTLNCTVDEQNIFNARATYSFVP